MKMSKLPLLPSFEGDKDGMQGPHKFSNWVVPKVVMAGAYPGAKKGYEHEETIHKEIIHNVMNTGNN